MYTEQYNEKSHQSTPIDILSEQIVWKAIPIDILSEPSVRNACRVLAKHVNVRFENRCPNSFVVL